MQLTERQEQILKTILETYIATAKPASSAAIAAASGLNVSSATVRNEMMVLEALWYVQHLHTSGGRVPTNAGYRYYVEHLMTPKPLPSSETRTIRYQFDHVHTETQEWLKLAANVMAHRMRNVGLVTAPRPAEVRMRHMEAIAIGGTTILLIVVLQDGTVLQEKETLDPPRSQEELSALADRLNLELRGLTAAQVKRKAASLAEDDARVARMVSGLLRHAEHQHAEIYHAGLADLIRQPEFLGPLPGETPAIMAERLRQMVEFLQQSAELERFLQDLSDAPDVRVVIGGDAGLHGLESYSFVLGRYGTEGDSSGYLGVVGPTRMQYSLAVSLVRYMTHLMTDLIQVQV